MQVASSQNVICRTNRWHLGTRVDPEPVPQSATRTAAACQPAGGDHILLGGDARDRETCREICEAGYPNT